MYVHAIWEEQKAKEENVKKKKNLCKMKKKEKKYNKISMNEILPNISPKSVSPTNVVNSSPFFHSWKTIWRSYGGGIHS